MGEETESGGSGLPAVIVTEIQKAPEGVRMKIAKLALRLIGGTDAVAAYVGRAQEKWDDIAARSYITQEMTKKIAEQAKADPAMVKRYAHRILGEGLLGQERIEGITLLAIEDLRDSPPNDPPKEDVSEEFLNKFSRYAEDVSNADAQKLWARVLAGEFRKPGSFSLRTLRFLSEFDKEVGSAFEEVCQNALGGNAVYIPEGAWNTGPQYIKIKLLVEAGLLAEAPGQSHRPINGRRDGVHFIWQERTGLLLKSDVPTSFNIPICLMTSVGVEMFRLLKPIDEMQVLENIAHSLRYSMLHQPSLAFVGERIETGDGAIVVPKKILWGDLATLVDLPK